MCWEQCRCVKFSIPAPRTVGRESLFRNKCPQTRPDLKKKKYNICSYRNICCINLSSNQEASSTIYWATFWKTDSLYTCRVEGIENLQ